MQRSAKKIVSILMVLAMVFGVVPTTAYAQEQKNEIQTITGFESLSRGQREFIINEVDKPDQETLVSEFPQTLHVYLEDEIAVIDVSWYCVGEDYETSDAYYYQFSPVWDDTAYALSENIDVLKDAPYISVFLTAADGIAEIAVTSIENETVIYEFLINEMGLNMAAACGVLANIYHESRFNPNALGDNGTSYGICQWHVTRWEAMKTWCSDNGYDWKTLIGQLNYLKFELSQNNYKYLWNGKTIFNYLSSVENTAQGAYDAGYYWCYYFEVPADKENKAITRGNLAKNTYWQEYVNDTTAPVISNVQVKQEVDGYTITCDVLDDCGVAKVQFPTWIKTEGKDSLVSDWETSEAFKGTYANGKASYLVNRSDYNGEEGTYVTEIYAYDSVGNVTTTEVKVNYPFGDVYEGTYCYDAVLWAVEQAVTTGKTPTTFEPDSECTRGQVVTFLWRAMGSPEPTTNQNPFKDVSADRFYYKAVLWAAENGITTGKTATIFAPDDTCTRSQVVAFLWRTMEEPESATTTNPFTDIAEERFYYQAVLWAVENKITTGKTITMFAPQDICTRGQVVTFLYRTFYE